MKSFIKKILRENLVHEIAPETKPVFGRGTFHQLFSFEKFPNKLFKIGEKKMVVEWVDIFKKYPEFFPKIYRVFPYSKNPNLYVVEIERLETKFASRDYQLIDEFLFEYSDRLQCGQEFLNVDNFYEPKCFDNVIEALNNTHNSKMIPLFTKWAKFLRMSVPIIEAELSKNSFGDIDLHSGNVAYDKFGNIKYIDI